MKKVKSLICLLLAISVILMGNATSVMALDIETTDAGACGDNVAWALDETGVLTIGGNGNITSAPWKDKGHTKEVKKVIISEGVTGITEAVFQDCENLEQVELPASITQLGSDCQPFIYCPKLKEINVAKDNSTFASEDGVVFTKDMKTLLVCPGGKKGSYTVPESVTKIKSEAFFDCQSLTGVTLPAGLKELEVRAFYRCYSLKSIEVPSGITVINKSVFEQCESLESVTLPAGITSIGKWAFWGDKSLKEITIPSGVTEIGEEAFQDCNSQLTILCSEGSYAESYAKNNNIKTSTVAKTETTNAKLTRSKTEVTLKKGKTVKLTVTLSKKLKKSGVTWKSSNKKVATVTKKGKVKAKGYGTAVITCTSKKDKTVVATCTVTVAKKTSSSTTENNENKNENEEKQETGNNTDNYKICSSCIGSGSVMCTSCGGLGSKNCIGCGGTGGTIKMVPGGIDPLTGMVKPSQSVWTTCSMCGGRGRDVCTFCAGTGRRRCVACSGTGKVKK
ncbi:MAG: leucine-rich repeat protein [Lachnospiraceae bacterium]|nr:leucine-rich repeat protein [Lachnospiraceae bacterium]